MIRKCLPGTLLVLALSAAFILASPGTGTCIQNTKIDLSEYRGIGNRTFLAYKYVFGDRIEGTLQLVITDTETGFHMEWNEEYPILADVEGDGTALYLAFDYDVAAEGVFETASYRYAVVQDEWGNPSRGDSPPAKFAYREPAMAPADHSRGEFNPLLTFPYAVVEVGFMWGDAFIEKQSRADVYFPRVCQFAVLGLEDVTVPAGTFADCVKVARFRGNQADRITWYAKGTGVVKMIYAQEEHFHNVDGTFYQVQGYNRAFVLESLGD